jgi:methylenetetrahydrofolate dehydrogenase (NADP+) / methenyltetrahydrofolate cyclohydrolase / formyltetrahydrofolate synthetase
MATKWLGTYSHSLHFCYLLLPYTSLTTDQLDSSSSSIRADIATRIKATQAKFPRFQPHLAIIQQGARSDSSTYVKMKLKAAAEAGIKCTLVVLGGPEDGVGEDEVMREVERLNNDDSVHGLLVQLPLSDAIGRDGERRITEAVSPEKDVDGCVSSRLRWTD